MTALQFNDPLAVTRFDAVTGLFRWMQSIPPAERRQFVARLLECSDEVQQAVIALMEVVKAPSTTPAERQRALMTIADALYLNPDEMDKEYGQDAVRSEEYGAENSPPLAREAAKMNTQEQAFADRLRELMTAKRISQRELAERVGCSQPAVSQILNRTCRPQRKTILKLADALSIAPRDLWPDIEVADVLDAAAAAHADGYEMTPAEAEALAATATKPRPRLRGKSLPPRPE